MEMTGDWRSFRSLFYPRRRSLLQNEGHSGPIIVLLNDQTIAAIYSESEDLSHWVGRSQAELSSIDDMKDRKILYLDRAGFDAWLFSAAGMNHYQEQLEYLRESTHAALEEAKITPTDALLYRRHFILDALQGWWSKVLPSAYGIYIRLEGQPGEDIFILVRRGRLETYGRPDLSSLSSERSRDTESIIKYLSEKHMVAVQGFFLSTQEWAGWAGVPQPWRKVALSIRAERLRLVPFRWGVVGLIAGRGFLGR